MLKNFEPNKIFVITSKAPKYVLGLFFIIILIFAVAAFMRRFSQGQMGSSKNINIIASSVLGAKERLVLIEVGGEQLLIGVTANHINTLHKLNTPIKSSNDSDDLSQFGMKLKEILTRTTTRES